MCCLLLLTYFCEADRVEETRERAQAAPSIFLAFNPVDISVSELIRVFFPNRLPYAIHRVNSSF